LAILINTPSSSSSEPQTSHHSWDVPAPQTTTPVFTRRDDVGDGYSDWLVAKMWVRVAHVHYHMLGSLIASRLLAETVSLAVYRCLPSVHPVSCTPMGARRIFSGGRQNRGLELSFPSGVHKRSRRMF